MTTSRCRSRYWVCSSTAGSSSAPATGQRLADDSSNRTFHKVEHPARFTSLAVQGNAILGIADTHISDRGPDNELVANDGLWISKNGGRKWSRFPVGDR